MLLNDILDDIIGDLQPENVPAEYIVMAKLVDDHGIERVVRGEELASFLAHPELEACTEARVVLDVRKIRAAIITQMNIFFDHLNEAISAAYGTT